MVVDSEIREAVSDLLNGIGEDPARDGLRDTPARVARMYSELFSGLDKDPESVLTTTFAEPYDEMIVLRDVPFFSMCEHHLLPFFGSADIGYIPGDRIVGLSKLARALEILSRRPQLQERLTFEVADAVEKALDPLGVAVRIQAEHLCMTMRGIKKPGSKMVTTVTRGAFRDNSATRAEFFDSVARG
ncbi:MAG: GTP cyclohydrolase I FolE [Chloroflexi bacterium]|nr:GTP cyclohydrolase I FolE [Chloroflexota bacterium]MCY3937223.1 GTP cyclohydrolase I FolE [Chloroflexota bacterium]